MSMQNFKFLASAVPEILGGPKIGKVGHVTQATPLLTIFYFFCLECPKINLCAKFQVSTFSRSRGIRGVPKFKSRSRDLGNAPL